ncbi:MAG TPA: hypothetical protein DHO02_01245 [Syntrophaceae bacterium]|jgi:acyl dehydratase|nr:MaoC/PaaZ C-terminal domain-containing protein [Smithellaceae bacterium]HBJ74699.1 hypothetical protein [Syntrophaceae bacterium]HCS77044.1 hypothetical protein [Syntrophaceae bacterium]HCX01046.1 hypothetical protein [Syntrophaceae bacterium]
MVIKFDAIQIGDAIPAYTSAPITRTHLVRYAGASGDFNPLHHDEVFARAIGLSTVIAHGMYIMGIAGEAVTSWIENRCLRKFSVHFLSMTQPVNQDDFENTKDRAIITVTGKVVDKYEENGEKRIRCELVAKDAEGSRKLSGYFVAALG